jgi:hypothetical protein
MEPEPIYSAENITITAKKIVAGQTTFAVDAIQAVWTTKHSQLAPLLVLLGLVAMLFGGAMMSCAGLAIGAISGETDKGWAAKAWTAIAVGLALLINAKRFPPFHFLVSATVSGQTFAVYQTPSIEQAQEIERAIATARGL